MRLNEIDILELTLASDDTNSVSNENALLELAGLLLAIRPTRATLIIS